jgi:hypothetical protein
MIYLRTTSDFGVLLCLAARATLHTVAPANVHATAAATALGGTVQPLSHLETSWFVDIGVNVSVMNSL